MGEIIPFKKPRPDSEKYNIAATNQKIDSEYPNMLHRPGIGVFPCKYCHSVNCDYDCEQSQENLHLESVTYNGECFIFEKVTTLAKAKLYLRESALPFAVDDDKIWSSQPEAIITTLKMNNISVINLS